MVLDIVFTCVEDDSRDNDSTRRKEKLTMWKLIETAPKGSGANGPGDTRHPDYVKPPRLLLFVDGRTEIGYYDWYYHDGYGMGAHERQTAWVHSGDDVEPTHWAELPQLPTVPAA